MEGARVKFSSNARLLRLLTFTGLSCYSQCHFHLCVLLFSSSHLKLDSCAAPSCLIGILIPWQNLLLSNSLPHAVCLFVLLLYNYFLSGETQQQQQDSLSLFNITKDRIGKRERKTWKCSHDKRILRQQDLTKRLTDEVGKHFFSPFWFTWFTEDQIQRHTKKKEKKHEGSKKNKT